MAPLLPVQSSMLAAIGYDPATRTLAVRFNNSNFVHHYKDVPAAEVDAVRTAESIGKEFNARIRGKYDSTAVAIEDAQQPADVEA